MGLLEKIEQLKREEEASAEAKRKAAEREAAAAAQKEELENLLREVPKELMEELTEAQEELKAAKEKFTEVIKSIEEVVGEEAFKKFVSAEKVGTRGGGTRAPGKAANFVEAYIRANPGCKTKDIVAAALVENPRAIAAPEEKNYSGWVQGGIQSLQKRDLLPQKTPDKGWEL